MQSIQRVFILRLSLPLLFSLCRSRSFFSLLCCELLGCAYQGEVRLAPQVEAGGQRVTAQLFGSTVKSIGVEINKTVNAPNILDVLFYNSVNSFVNKSRK